MRPTISKLLYEKNIFKLTVVAMLILFLFLLSGCNSGDSDEEAQSKFKFTSLAMASVNENQTAVTILSVEDTNDSKVSFSISGTDSSSFDLNTTSGVLTFKVAPDYETKTLYTLIATADNGSEKITQNMIITIKNIAEVAPIIDNFISAIDENITIGSIVGIVNVTNSTDSNITLFVLNDIENFDINSTGHITTKTTFDYENKTSYSLKVYAINGAGNSSSASVTIDINNLNDNKPSFVSSNTISVSENQTTAITLSATDADNDKLIFNISGTDSSSFNLNSSSGVVTFKVAPDYETKTSYTFSATVSDGINEVSQNITLNIKNIYDVLPVLQNFTNSIDENITVGTSIGKIGVISSGDSSVSSFILSDNESFNIDAVGNIVVKESLDYETKILYSLNVYATNSAGSSSSISVVIDINNVNDNKPIFTSASIVTVDENKTAVLTLKATDADNDTLTFSISGIDSSSFDLNTVSGLLSFKVAPDYETKTSYILLATVSDGVNEVSQNITIDINNLNDNEPVFTSASSVVVNENQTTAITLSATDADYDTLTFNISGADSSSFDFNTTSRIVKFKVAPDYETKATYTFLATVSDSKNLVNQNVTININNTDETDNDNDFIPNDIEVILGTNPNNSDENNNSILDGLETTGLYGDQFFDKQWHIRSLGTTTNDSGVATIVGNDLDVLDIYHKYMGYNKGNNIIIQVVDTGVDADHEDLIDNMDLNRSYHDGNGDGNSTEIGDPSGEHWHGTAVAGIMAARAFNAKGVRGIIPFAKIAGSNWLEHQTTEGLVKAWFSGNGANEIVVTNNSWGSYVSNGSIYELIMEYGTTYLRDGKGRIYVFAAGNSRREFGNANLEYSLNNRYMIAVAALKHDNTHTVYSTAGSNVLVSGYSGNFYIDSPTISTTIIMGQSSNTGSILSKTTWSEDISENYTFIMNGTSAAAPTVAASIALVLEACPDLTWRDVKYLVAKNAKSIDTANASWVQNAAGLWHSIDYGFGLINPKGMIAECSTNYTNLTAEQNQTLMQVYDTDIPDDNSVQSFILPMRDDDITIEWVELTVDNNSTFASDYNIELTSPAGTKTTLMTENTLVSKDYFGAWMSGGWRFGSAAMMGEGSKGIWKVDIRDTNKKDEGALKALNLKIYGH